MGVARRGDMTELLSALAACTAFAVVANWRLLHRSVVSADALVHQYWMWHWKDAGLFNDPLTAELRHSARYPDGYQALFWLASHVADPIFFGELVGVALMALSGVLVFLIVREHTAWRPAAWIGAALFLAPVEIHRFFGGFPRGFVHPVVLLTVLLALRRRHVAAALVAASGALFYPPAALLAVGTLIVSARLDRRRLALAGLALALTAAVVLLPGGAPRVMTASEARAFMEFGEHGPLHFFVPSLLEYLRQNRSGFDLRTAGSIVAVAAIALLALRRTRLRAEVWALPIVSLGAFAVSQAVLFRLYLPHRYTYPLLAFFAIAIAVSIRPAWESLGRRRLGALALLAAPAAVCAFAIFVFPLAPPEPRAGAAAVALLAVPVVLALRPLGAAAGALVTAATLVVALLVLPGPLVRQGTACPQRPVTRYLAGLPKDAVIAGDPADLLCIPATTHRAVVISTQLAPAYEADYFRHGRARMFADLRAYYGPSAAAIADLARRYGATHLLLRRDALAKEVAGSGRWRAGKLPYGRYVRGLVNAVPPTPPAALSLPAACRTWQRGPVEVYDITCMRVVSTRHAPRDPRHRQRAAARVDQTG
jgi:hypothetical protein